MNVSRIWFSASAALLLLLYATPGRAEDAANYPSQNIKIIVPFPAGGTADTLPRIVAERLRQKWGQAVIIENRSGAGGNIGADAVASSAPDGYTLLASPPGPIAINENLYKKLSFRPADLMPITVIGTAPNVLDVRPDFPAKTVRELIDYAKTNPDKVTFASQGNGTTSHLTAVLFEKLTGTKMVHVPYRGTSPALQDIMGNTVDVFFDNLGSSMSLHLGEVAHPWRLRQRARRQAAGCAGRARRRVRFHVRHLVCADGPEGHAGAHRRQAKCRRDRNPARARHQGTIRKARRSTRPDGHRRDGEIHRRGTRALGRNHQVSRCDDRLKIIAGAGFASFEAHRRTRSLWRRAAGR
jgi:hypothetical protein